MMETTPFVIERTLNSPIDRVWTAISDKDEMKKWYFDLAEFKPEKGVEFHFDGCGDDNTVYRHLCVVKDVIPGRKLSYSWRYEGYEGDSLVTFELFPEGNQTRLKLTHEGLETFPKNNPIFAKESFATGWDEIIGKSLPAFLAK